MPSGRANVTDALGSTPRLIRFEDGAFCEVTDVAMLGRVLAAHGHHEKRVVQWEGSLTWIVAAGVALLAVLVVGYRYGVPALAAVAAEHVPEKLVTITSQETLKLLDGVFVPTELDETRRARLVGRFKRLRSPDGEGVPSGTEICSAKATHWDRTRWRFLQAR